MNEKKEIVRILSKLVEANTVNPPGNEYKAAKVFEDEFKKLKIPYKKFEKQKNRTNIIGSIGKGKNVLAFVGHLDTVPEGDGWKTNPHKPVVKNGKLYGRGSEDNKGACASLLVAAKELKKRENELNGKVLIVGAADEEKGSDFGARFLLEKKHLKTNFAVIPDIGQTMNVYDVGEKGLLHLRVEAIGKQCHGSRPWQGVNAVLALSEFCLEAEKINFPKPASNFTKTTVNIGAIHGGTAPNIVVGKANALLDIRYSGKINEKQIISRLNLIKKKIIKKFKGLKLKIIVKQSYPCVSVKNKTFMKLFEDSVKEVTKKKPKKITLEGTTIAKNFNMHNIPAVGFGIGSGIAHQANENVSIKDLVKYSEFVVKFSLKLLK